ncbi:SDR family oxidoreductase [Algicola sagamiensis]|uniref:SDR family oxidoreductase n=1 Tax=Algicola sagamiensis TaxID=163869 RepID=UPI000378882E|nr:SDR family oxidoreductase [Algicola sagamiensis]
MNLKDKVIIVTGASEGIGRAFCLEAIKEGAKISLAARNQERLQSLKSELESLGGEAICTVTDVTRQQHCQNLIESTVEHFGQIDILVNNAGMTMWSLFEDIEDLSIFDDLYRVNVMGAVCCTHFALPYIKQRQGMIVAVSSLAGLTGVPTRSAYCATKHAMIGFFDALRIELMDTGVSVVNIAPDFVRSEIHKRALDGKGVALGDSPMTEDKIMTAEEFAFFMVDAIHEEKRLAIPSLRGKLGRILKIIAPGMVDRLARHAIENRY